MSNQGYPLDLKFDLAVVADIGTNRKQLHLERLLPQIESSLDAGRTHREIHAYLCSVGLILSWKQYENALARVRKKARPDTGSVAHHTFAGLGANRSSFSTPFIGDRSLQGGTILPSRRVSLPGLEPVPNTLGFDSMESVRDAWLGNEDAD